MTDMIHIHSEGKQVGNVCVPGPFTYQAAVHQFGAREWVPVGERGSSIAEAFQALGVALEENRGKAYPRWNRGGIWAIEEDSYYDPHKVYEVTVR